MCGYYFTNQPISKDSFLRKLDRIKFRGPDFTGYQYVNNFHLGHVRLAVLDLNERSNQPFLYKGYYILFNGEIYNFLDLKHILLDKGYVFTTSGDTEVLLFGFLEWGKEVLNKVNGMFSFVIFNSVNNSVFAARDRLGVLPMYYYLSHGFLSISSQISPFYDSMSSINEESLSIYLELGYIPSPFSILNGVFKLPPGSYLVYENASIQIHKYWDLERIELLNISFSEAKTKLKELLVDSVRIRMNSDVPIVNFLSGGIDSSLVTAIASQLSEEKITTINIGFSDNDYDESDIAKIYSEILKTNHVSEICTVTEGLNEFENFFNFYDEPFADSSALPTMLLSRITKSTATVAISGDGGDESFMGYKFYDSLGILKKLFYIPYFFRYLISLFPWHFLFKSKPETIKSLLRCSNLKELALKLFEPLDSIVLKKPDWHRIYYPYFDMSNELFQNVSDINIKLWLENDSNVKVDRASKGYGVEVRSPFLDYRIVEFARSLPKSYKIYKKEKKFILKEILKDYIPKDKINFRKKGFSVPLGSWIREDLKHEILLLLNDDFLKSIPNLNFDVVKEQIKNHFENHLDYSTNIWKLYILSKWIKKFNLYKDDENII